jgi:light-regulated signal transduction histidine kinase (bacteriophytochrome)
MTETQFQRLLAELAQVSRRIDKTEASLLQRLSDELAQVNRRIGETNAETRRHFDVVAEGLEHKIQLVAEGVMSLEERFEAAQRQNAAEHTLTRTEIRLTFGNLDRRVSALEQAGNN